MTLYTTTSTRLKQAMYKTWTRLESGTNQRYSINKLEDLDFANDIAHHSVAETLADGRQVIQLSQYVTRGMRVSGHMGSENARRCGDTKLLNHY